jgi:hypothetical protein
MLRQTTIVVGALLLLVSCGGGGSDVADADIVQADGGATDVGNVDVLTPDVAAPVDAALVIDAATVKPLAPSLSSPQLQSKADGTLSVTGVADPSAEVVVRVLLGDNILVRRTLIAGSDGSFSLNLTYRGVAHMQTFMVDALQVTAKGVSDSTRVSVIHDVPYSVTGTLSQAPGSSTKGSKVIVRLYRNADIAHVLDYVAEQTVVVAADNVAMASYSLPAAPGPYWVRAFRDSFGPKGGEPDGQPSFGFDAQVIGTVSVTNPITNSANLVLRAPDSSSDRYQGFNVLYNNITPQAIPPSVKVGDKRIVGKGLCLGFFVDAGVSRLGQVSAVSKPWLKLPSGQIVEMKDDGACSETVRDNSGSSFDEAAADKNFRYGIPDPDEHSEGQYAFFYRHESSSHIHIEIDELKAKIKMPLLREFSSPDGSSTLRSRMPKLSWTAVPNAKFYQAHLRALSGGWDNNGQPGSYVNSSEYTPTTLLPDNTCFELIVSAYDADPSTSDVDAFSYAHSHYFCVDVDGADTVEVTGSITNKTAQNYPIMVRVSTKNNRSVASVRVPANSVAYKVAMLKDAANAGATVNAFIDRAGSGLDSSLENQGYEVNRDNLKLGTSLNLPIVFNLRVAAGAPSWFAEASSKPKFVWEDYSITAGANKPAGPYSYALWVGAESSTFPPLIYALPSSATVLDLSNPPSGLMALDVGAYANCIGAGGVFSTNTAGIPACAGATLKPSLKELSLNSLYVWAIVVLECDFEELVHPAKSGPPAVANSFMTCVQKALADSQSFAQSAETPFYVK